MSEKDLVVAVLKHASTLLKPERIAKTRKIALESPELKEFVKKTYPSLYEEAFGN